MREPDWKTMYRILEEGIEKCIGCLGHDRISLEVEKYLFAALQDAGVPILMQAYPDEIGKMDFKHRRDAFCGKFSVTDVPTIALS